MPGKHWRKVLLKPNTSKCIFEERTENPRVPE